MIYYFLNNADISSDVNEKSLQVTNQLQQRSDNCSFTKRNSVPIANQDLKIFKGTTIANIAGTTLTLDPHFQTDCGFFYVGQKIHLGINQSYDSVATVSGYTESSLQLIVDAVPAGLQVGGKIGEIIFGGVVAKTQDQNIQLLQNIEYRVSGVDYTKIFDRKIISGDWANVDGRYILNDMCNSSVNYNLTLDDMSYADNAAIQAAWIEGGDGSNPTVDTTDFMEDISSAVLAWTHSSGVATWHETIGALNLSDLTGMNSGQPTKGNLMLWCKAASLTGVAAIYLYVGSDSTHRLRIDMTPTIVGDWAYLTGKLSTALIDMYTPDWTAVTYLGITIIASVSGSIKLNGMRINAENSFTLQNVQSTPVLGSYKAQLKKPMELINDLANALDYVWFVGYERDINFKDIDVTPAPFSLSDTSNNFLDLQYGIDISNLGNRIIINGGTMPSTSFYKQVFQGDGVLRQWVLQYPFVNLSILYDDGTHTKTAESGTTTTTVKVTGHGFNVGDHVVNRSRSNAVREILTKDADHFTVQTVTGQTNGDTISYFGTAKTCGVEGDVDESTVDFVFNADQKAVRMSTQTYNIVAGTYVEFKYNEVLPIQFQYTDTASANRLKFLGLGDGIFDLAPITDQNIKDFESAVLYAEAKVNQFSNGVIQGQFKTIQSGLRAGQLLHITQTINRGLDEDFVIQKVTMKQVAGKYQDYFEYDVGFGTTLFGWIELMQKVLRRNLNVQVDNNQVIETLVANSENPTISDTNAVAINGGFVPVKKTESPIISDTNTIFMNTPPWEWETSTGQTCKTRWGLFQW